MEKFDQRNVTEKFDDSLRKHSIKTLKNNKAIQRDSILNFNKRNNSLSKSFVVSKNDGQEPWHLQKNQVAEMIGEINQKY